jgi:glycosyltransferase involved in cell wall biosynthesis
MTMPAVQSSGAGSGATCGMSREPLMADSVELASIILPTYNRAYCLPATIDSVLRQSHRALEIVIVDDGSTDGTGALIAARYGHDPRVRYHYRTNGGVSAARNTAMELARGPVLVFCDSDDVWNPDKLLLQMATFARFPEVGLVWTDVTAVDSAGTVLHERYTRTCYPAWQTQPIDTMFARSEEVAAGCRVYVGDIFQTMIGGTLINMPAVAIRADLARRIGNFDESMRTGEDYDFNLRACGAGPVAFIDVPTVRYRIGAPDQLTRPSLHADQARNWFRTLSHVRDAARLVGLSDQRLRPILRGKYQWLGMAEIECGERRAGRVALWSAIRYGSHSPRVWMTFLGTFLPTSLERSLRAVLRSVKARVGARKAAS